jgi:membrane associated rhomboid family serine protease
MVAPAPVPRRSIARVLPPSPVGAALIMLVFTALLYVVEAVDQVTALRLDDDGIVSRNLDGLWGILWAPFLHGGWPHLISNTVPFLVFGFLAIWVLCGLGVWLVGPSGTSTIGASGVIFGWLVFLLARGFFARSARQIGLAVVLVAVWGSVLFGVLPGQPGISWQAHLFGALAGLLAASIVVRADRPASLSP